MQITQRIPKFSIVIISLIFFWILYKVGIGIVGGRLKSIYLPIACSILIMIPYIVEKIGAFSLFCGLVFVYWIPFDSRLQTYFGPLIHVYPTEFGVWMLCMGILIHGSVTRNAEWNSAVGRFPFLPFSLFIGGALITYLATVHYSSYPLIKIRTFCLLPALFCFLCIYLIKTLKQAEYLLWIFLISAGLLGLVYLYAPQIAHPVSLDSIAGSDIEVTGRIRRIIHLPLFGPLRMSPETTPVCFAFVIALAFNLWLNHPSFWGRSGAATILAISGLIIVQGRGRTGLISAGCSVVVIMALTLVSRKHSSSLFSKSLLKAGIAILLLFGSVWYYASISAIAGIRERGLSLFTDPLHVYGLDARIWRMKESIHIFFDHPFFGVGFEGFPKHLSIYGSPWFPHNFFLYLLLSVGFIGFIGFLWIFIGHAKACWSGLHSDNLNRQILCIGGLGCITALFVAGMASCICSSPWQILMVWIPVGIIMAAATLKDGEAKGVNKGGRRQVSGVRRQDSGGRRQGAANDQKLSRVDCLQKGF